MIDVPQSTLYDERYRALGLLGSPLRPRHDEINTDTPFVRLVMHNAALSVLARIDRGSAAGDSRPVRVEKGVGIPNYYITNALSETLREMARPESRVLANYVPLELMKRGRVRSALNALGERLSGSGFEDVLAGYAAAVLAEPDTELVEFEPLAGVDLDAIVEALRADSGEVATYFGEYVGEREGVDDMEVLMRVSQTRQRALESDPEESDEDDENNPDDNLSEIYTTRLDDGSDTFEPLPTATEPVDDADVEKSEESEFADAVAAYVAAHARVHLSPVIARAIRAYKAQGASSAAQELKITKAPRKTLKALVVFARHYYRSVALLYDRFDSWPLMPQDMRAKIVAALTDLRWALADGGTLVIFHAPGQAPELEEQFAGADVIAWDMAGLPEYEMKESLALDVPSRWFSEAAVSEPHLSGDDAVFSALLEAAEGDADRFVSMAAAALDDVVARGAEGLDETALAAGRATDPESD